MDADFYRPNVPTGIRETPQLVLVPERAQLEKKIQEPER
jgi:hypothetical protein